ncbi:MAG: hypothetical protein V7K21_06010 [Nostoc sp.]|uniref:hypothetical protein n=1 Tax=Nostoc sp. TaxID=1180 RepID=UPI002FFADE62
MTDESQSNNSDEEEFDPVTYPRDWSAAETELACFALARSKGKRLVTAEFKYLNHICRKGTALLCPYHVVYLPENSCKIINTKKPPMPIICIFEDYPE